jgi:phosphatidylglycerol:prolipoprotein diacylglycerol transferase
VQPEIDVLGIPVKTFGVMFALGFVLAGAVITRRLRELGRPVDWAYEIAFSALLGGLVGSRLYWLAEHPDELSEDLLGALFGGSGLTWYGGVIGGALAVGLWARRRGVTGLDLVDLCAAPLALGYAMGRVGCQLSGDGDYGKESDLPWAMGYPDGTVPTDPGVEVHPTPIYETLATGLLAWALWRWRGRLRPGLIFAWYLVGAGVERFLVEFVRRNEDVALGLTTAQFESLAIFAAGAVWLVVAARRGGLRAEPA